MDVQLSGGEEYDCLVAPVRKLCKFIAIWPMDLGDVDGDMMKLEKARKLQIYYRLFIFMYMSMLFVAQVADVFYNWGKMEEITECCLLASSCILTMFRFSIYSFHQKHVYLVLGKMRSDWDSVSEEDKEILRKKCVPAFMMSRYFIACISVTMSIFFIQPTLMVFLGLSDEWKLPYGGYFYLDITKSPTYQILYAVKVLGGIYGLANVAALNSFNLLSITHASANFLILQNHLTGLRSDGKRSRELVRLYIQEHQRAIEFADILEILINKAAFGQFIVSTGLVCFAGLQITEREIIGIIYFWSTSLYSAMVLSLIMPIYWVIQMMDNKLHLVTYAVYLSAAIFELFLFSWSGYQLTLESELVGDSAFNSDWVGSPFTQNLNIVMMRATKPSKITAAKFYDMSLESFSMVLSTSFSYFTTLRAMTDD